MKYFLNLNDSVSCQQDVGQFFKDRLYGADYFHRSLKKLTGLQPIYIAWSGSCSIFDQEDFTWWTLAGHNRYCCQKSNLDPMETIHVYTWVVIGLWDSFISCWDTKYESGRKRILPNISIQLG